MDLEGSPWNTVWIKLVNPSGSLLCAMLWSVSRLAVDFKGLSPLGLSRLSIFLIPILCFLHSCCLLCHNFYFLFFEALASVPSYSWEHTSTFHPLSPMMKRILPFTVHCSTAFLPLCSILRDSKFKYLRWFRVMSELEFASLICL